MDPTENFIKPCPNPDESFTFAASNNLQEYNPQTESVYNPNATLKLTESAPLNVIEGANIQAEKPLSECSLYSNPNPKYTGDAFSTCFETFSRQLNNMPNNANITSSFHKMYGLNYNMAVKSDSTGDNENMEARNSVLEAILEIEFCNIPLRQEVVDLLISEGDPNFKKPLKYEDYIRVESSPVLHKLESERMEELKNACLMLRNPYKHVVHKTNQLVDAVKVTEAAIRRLIKMSKRLSAFNKLSQNDQISLLKGSIIEMMCIRATTNFNSEHNFWYFIDDNNQGLTMVSLDVLKNANWINFMSHKNFAIKFNSQFKNDPMIADLLTAIILFRPSRASTSNQELIRDEFLNYCYLLKRYLYVNSSGDKCKAKSAYIALMHRLEELYYLAEDIVRIYLDMDPENAGPLFVELFDLK